MTANTAKPMSAAMLNGGRKLADPQLSPDGRWVSMVARGGARSEIALIDLRDGMEWQLPLEPGVVSSRGGSHKWLPSGDSIAYLGVDGRLYVFDLKSLRSRMVTEEEAADCSALAVSNNGLLAAYVVDLQHVHVVALDGQAPPVCISTDADFAVDPCFSVYSDLVAWHEWDVPNMAWDTSRIVVRDAEANQEKRVVYEVEGVAVQQPRFSPDGMLLGFLSDESGWLNLWAVDARTFENPRQLLHDESEHGDLTWGPGQSTYVWTDRSERVVVSQNRQGFGALVDRSLPSQATTSEFSGAFTNLHAVGDVVVGLVSDYARATEVAVIQGGVMRSIARTAYFGVDSTARRPELVSWKSKDGAEIPGRLYRAVSDDPKPPLLVWIHGGPHGQSTATFFSRWTYFLERGWSILVPDYRGTSGWGRSYLQSIRGRWGEADVEDVVAGIHAAAENDWCDPARVVVVGGSAGGLTVLSVLARHPSLCAAGVALYPVTDLLQAQEQTWRFEAHYFDSLVGPLPERHGLYVERSPITHAAAIKAPVYLFHGTADVSVPPAQSAEMAKAIAAAGGTVEVRFYDGEGHGWKKPETTIDELGRVESFLSRYVLDVTTEGSKS